MAKKRRPPPKNIPKQRKALRPHHRQGDRFLLDEFSSAELRTWKNIGEARLEFEIRRYHELEALRQLHHNDLIEALQNIAPTKLKLKNWSRIVDLQFSNQPLSAAGSLISGGRFNIGNDCDKSSVTRFPALYLAENHETAMLERFGGTKQGQLSPSELALRQPQSYAHVRLKGEICAAFDLQGKNALTQFTKVISSFGLSSDLVALGKQVGEKTPGIITDSRTLQTTLLAREWRFFPRQYGLPANPQIFAALIRDAGFEAIRYKSVKGGKHCLAVFSDKFTDSDSVVALADEAPSSIAQTELTSKTWGQLI